MQVDSVYQYVDDVLHDRVLACRWIKLACERFNRNLGRKDIYFHEDQVHHVLNFFGRLKLWKGREYKGKPFILGPHYQFIVANIFGWKLVKDHTRLIKTVYIEEARKAAKSTFAGGVGAYMLTSDGEDGAECYAAAVKKDQAKIVWANIRNLLKTSIFAPMVTFHTNNLFIENTWSKCEPLSSDSKSLDGLDTHFASLDELHAHPTPDVHNLVDDSTGSRSQALILMITTAGFDQAGVCYQRREYLTKILKNIIQDDSFFGMIYTLDTAKDWPELDGKDGHEKEDDWTNEDVWIKANPGLCGVTKSGQRFGIDERGEPMPGYMTKIEDIRKQAQYALEIPAAQNNFLTKRMNIWTQQATRWLSLKLWDENFTREVAEDGVAGRMCFGAIDLSSISDLTVWTMLFPDPEDPELIDILIRAWCPEARLYDKKNKYRDQYQAWEKAGFLKTTEGDAVDYGFVRAQIVEDSTRFKIDSINVDRAFQGYEFSMKLNEQLGGTEKDPKVIAFGMGYLSMAGPANELERRLLKRKLNHGGNPVLRWMADNVSVSEDPAGNKKPNKATSQGKIDGIVGILMALDRVLRTNNSNPFETMEAIFI